MKFASGEKKQTHIKVKKTEAHQWKRQKIPSVSQKGLGPGPQQGPVCPNRTQRQLGSRCQAQNQNSLSVSNARALVLPLRASPAAGETHAHTHARERTHTLKKPSCKR